MLRDQHEAVGDVADSIVAVARGDEEQRELTSDVALQEKLQRLFVFTLFFDVVMEGLFLMPMGLFTYPGAMRSLSIFPGTYHQYPIYEAALWGSVQAGLCALRFFTDDRRRTFVGRARSAADRRPRADEWLAHRGALASYGFLRSNTSSLRDVRDPSTA